MAYNQDKTIIILDTQNWTVKKTLTDEKVFRCAHTKPFEQFKVVNALKAKVSVCCTHSRFTPNIVYVRIRSVANIFRPVGRRANFPYGILMRIN